VDIENRRPLEALMFRCKTGCAWRDIPESYGSRHAIYTRFNRQSKNGVLKRTYTALAAQGLEASPVFGLDSTAVKAHPDAHGAEKNGAQATGKMRGGWNTKIHVVATGDATIAGFR